MKNLAITASSIFIVTGCASAPDVKNEATCKVWKQQPILGPRVVEVSSQSAELSTHCLLMNMWICSRAKADIETSGDIYFEGGHAFAKRTKIAHLKEGVLTYDETAFSALGAIEPIQIDISKNSLTKSTKSKILGGMTAETELQFNRACDAQSVAVGAVVLWGTER